MVFFKKKLQILLIIVSIFSTLSRESVGVLQSRRNVEKRAVAETVLLALQVLEGAIMIYRGEGSCSDAASDFQGILQDFKDTVDFLRNKRDKINLNYGKANANRRFSRRLNSTSATIEIVAKNIVDTADGITSSNDYGSVNISVNTGGGGGKNPLVVKPRLNLAKAKNAVSVMSKAAEEITGGLAIVAVLANFAFATSIHHDDCVERRDAYKAALGNLKKEKVKLIKLDKTVEQLYRQTLKEYKYSKEVFLQLGVVEWMEKMKKSLSNHPSLNNSIVLKKISVFLEDYYLLKANDIDKKLQEISTKSLPSLLRKTMCLRDKNLVIKQSVYMCIRGKIDLMTYFNSKIKGIKTCDLSQEKSSMLENVYQRLRTKSKSKTCSLNDEDKRRLVCFYKKKFNNAAIIQSKVNLTLAHVHYFMNHCSLPGVTVSVKTLICRYKKDGISSQDVLLKFSQYNQDDVKMTYDNCSLDDTQKQMICHYKNEKLTLKIIQENKFPTYNKTYVQTVYDKCIASIKKIDERIICALKSSKTVAVIAKVFKHKYTDELVRQTYNSC